MRYCANSKSAVTSPRHSRMHGDNKVHQILKVMASIELKLNICNVYIHCPRMSPSQPCFHPSSHLRVTTGTYQSIEAQCFVYIPFRTAPSRMSRNSKPTTLELKYQKVSVVAYSFHTSGQNCAVRPSVKVNGSLLPADLVEKQAILEADLAVCPRARLNRQPLLEVRPCLCLCRDPHSLLHSLLDLELDLKPCIGCLRSSNHVLDNRVVVFVLDWNTCGTRYCRWWTQHFLSSDGGRESGARC